MADDYRTGRTSSSNYQRSGFFYIIGRVSHIVMSDIIEGTNSPDPNFSSYEDLGKISFDILYSNLTTNKSKKVNDYAYPMFGFMNQYPLINEIVIVFPGPSEALNDDFESKQLFYLPPYNVWKFNPNHSAFPNLLEWQQYLIDNISTNAEYNTSKVPDLQAFLGQYFKELQNVRKLKPFEGDTIIESRFGQTIRFGSTTPKVKRSNYWSNNGSQGSPITMIVNGQGAPENKKDQFAPTLENINKDVSSFYMTVDQEIILEDLNNFNFRSFGGIRTQAQENTDNVRVITPPIISNEEIDAASQDRNAIG